MGDELIRQVSERLSSSIRKHDTVARFGGDEFLMILNNMSNINDLQKKVNSIMNIFQKPFVLNMMEYYVTCSAGVSVYPVDGMSQIHWLKMQILQCIILKTKGKMHIHLAHK